MVSRPTGREPGRPRKRPAKPKGGRGRGRPTIMSRPGWHVYAMFEAYIERAKEHWGISELQMLERIAKDLQLGDDPIRLPSWRIEQIKENPSQLSAEGWRLGKANRPLAWDLRRTLERLRKGADADHFQAMTASWRLCLDGELEKANEARRLAAYADMEAVFDEQMLPIMRDWHALIDAYELLRRATTPA